MPKGIPLTPEEVAARRRQIFDAAVPLLVERGFPETSMREIAEAAGMGKSSLYDYFKSKDEILVFVLEEELEILLQQAQAIAASCAAPEERLRQIMQMHLAFMQANASLFARLSAEVQRLNANGQQGIQARRYAYQDLVAGVIQTGIDEGCFRPVHALNAARLLINSLVSVLYTSRPSGSAEEMMDEAVAIFLYGLRQ